MSTDATITTTAPANSQDTSTTTPAGTARQLAISAQRLAELAESTAETVTACIAITEQPAVNEHDARAELAEHTASLVHSTSQQHQQAERVKQLAGILSEQLGTEFAGLTHQFAATAEFDTADLHQHAKAYQATAERAEPTEYQLERLTDHQHQLERLAEIVKRDTADLHQRAEHLATTGTPAPAHDLNELYDDTGVIMRRLGMTYGTVSGTYHNTTTPAGSLAETYRAQADYFTEYRHELAQLAGAVAKHAETLATSQAPQAERLAALLVSADSAELLTEQLMTVTTAELATLTERCAMCAKQLAKSTPARELAEMLTVVLVSVPSGMPACDYTEHFAEHRAALNELASQLAELNAYNDRQARAEFATDTEPTDETYTERHAVNVLTETAQQLATIAERCAEHIATQAEFTDTETPAEPSTAGIN